MVLILLMFLCLPLALMFSFLSGLTVLKQNTALGIAIQITSLLGVASILWELRFDIEVISHLFTYEQLNADYQPYFMALYIALFAMVLLARLRWNRAYGNGVLLTLALVFWGRPYPTLPDQTGCLYALAGKTTLLFPSSIPQQNPQVLQHVNNKSEPDPHAPAPCHPVAADPLSCCLVRPPDARGPAADLRA